MRRPGKALLTGRRSTCAAWNVRKLSKWSPQVVFRRRIEDIDTNVYKVESTGNNTEIY
jgi:hypothetical protein